ncbi:MAG: hypothetical protein J6A59_03320 [Lachnospiraceae bacterium]|nr:hypothetical protein [Lachnospiraceae bacterium]
MDKKKDIKRKERPSNCESCAYYMYDDEYECYVCDVNLDEDEMARFMSDKYYNCPYYKYGDEYSVVRKQM